MRRLVPMALGILVATLTMSGIGQAQGVTPVQGTIQAVDCQTNALVVNAPDGTHVFPAGPNTAVFVNSAPVGFCTLQRYIGSNASVSLTSSGNGMVIERVDVSVAAIPGSGPSPAPGSLITGMPKWAEIALGAVIIGGIVYLGIHGAHQAAQNQPDHQCSDGSWGKWCP